MKSPSSILKIILDLFGKKHKKYGDKHYSKISRVCSPNMPLTKSQRLIKYFKDNKIALSFGKN
jgi:hypothetical protein